VFVVEDEGVGLEAACCCCCCCCCCCSCSDERVGVSGGGQYGFVCVCFRVVGMLAYLDVVIYANIGKSGYFFLSNFDDYL
jgi:hypothetical protein